MKRLVLTAALVAAAVAGVKADTKMVIPSVDEAKAQGWEALWGDYTYGYVMPENYTFVDNDEISLKLNKAANVATSCKVEGYSVNLQMGSSLERESNTPVYTLDPLYSDMKQPYAILTLTPKKNGKISFTYCRGNNGNTTMYVWDTNASDGLGAYVAANSSFFDETDEAGMSPMAQTVTVNVRKDHTYYIFGAEAGANTDFYDLTFVPYASENYSTKATGTTEMAIPSVDEAKAQGWDALWGDYTYGYVMPENYVLTDNDDITLQLNKEANVSTSCTVDGYDINLQMGSSLPRESNTAVYMLDPLYDGMKQPYAILTLTPKKNGQISFSYCRGKNSNTTMYVWDTNANGDIGAYVTANSTFFDETEDAGLPYLAHTVTVNVVKGHKYYIFGAETGANTEFYSLAFTSYKNQTAGIENAVTSVADTPADGKIYTIDGRYVGKDKAGLAKGLYISNGKKFIVK